MKTFKWTVPSAQHTDPRSMDRGEYTHWARIRARGCEWFIVKRGLLLLVAVPWLSALTGGPGFRAQVRLENPLQKSASQVCPSPMARVGRVGRSSTTTPLARS